VSETLPGTGQPDAKKTGGAFFAGCLKLLIEIVFAILAILAFPFVLLWALIHWLWPWYSSIPPVPTSSLKFSDALIALASVAGVLWSGAIVAYSIHHKYTPPLRTGVQLLNFAIIAPLIGLTAEGGALRTAFYVVMWFFILSFLLSTTSVEMMRPGKFTLRPPDPKANETAAETQLRLQLTAARIKNIDLFTRLAHGTKYFAMVVLLCLAVFITAKLSVIAWSCLIVLVVSLFLMLPEVFRLDESASGGDT
jgi:hypothetical protein